MAAGDGVEKTPGVCGGSACIMGTRIPVWTLVNYWRLGSSEEELLRNFPSLKPGDLGRALEYALVHPEEAQEDPSEEEPGG